jgi:hypothetical protein
MGPALTGDWRAAAARKYPVNHICHNVDQLWILANSTEANICYKFISLTTQAQLSSFFVTRRVSAAHRHVPSQWRHFQKYSRVLSVATLFQVGDHFCSQLSRARIRGLLGHRSVRI